MTNKRSVICGLSACYYHGLIQDAPRELYVATRRTDRGAMKLTFPMSRHFFSVDNFEDDILTWNYHDIEVKVYDIDRSVADAIRIADDPGDKSIVEMVRTYKERSDADPDRCIVYADMMRVGRIVRDILGDKKK